jgi:predicted ATPase
MENKKCLPIQTVTLIEDKYNLKKGLSIKLKNITLLVGEQGCGKSTLLSLLRDNKSIKTKLSDQVQLEGIETFYFDSEKMNPRIQDLEMFTKPNGESTGIGMGAALRTHFMSHGEVLREYTVNRIKDAKNCILFLDEPESALSLKNQYRLAGELKSAVLNNVQIIASTHCLPLIESVDEVYSLEHKMWMKSIDFINLSKSE